MHEPRVWLNITLYIGASPPNERLYRSAMLALYGVSVVGSSHIPGIEDEYGLMGLVRTYIECEIAKSIDYCDPRVIKFLNSDF